MAVWDYLSSLNHPILKSFEIQKNGDPLVIMFDQYLTYYLDDAANIQGDFNDGIFDASKIRMGSKSSFFILQNMINYLDQGFDALY